MIKSILNAPHYLWGDHCEGWQLCLADDLSVIQENMPPGTKEQMHFHQRCLQVFYILQGTACFYLDQDYYEVNAGESIQILAGQKHYVQNTTEEDLKFLVISQPSPHRPPIDRVNID